MMSDLTPERRAVLRRVWLARPGGHARDLLALLDAADERDTLAAAAERVRAMADDWEFRASLTLRDGRQSITVTTAVKCIRRALDGPMSDATVTAPDPAGLDQLIDAIANLEIPLRHDLALCCLLELRDARLEIHELTSEVIRQMREIAALRAEKVNTDPLDETDHRPRHTKAGQMLYRHGLGHWHSFANAKPCMADCPNSIALWARTFGPLTICTCPEADHV